MNKEELKKIISEVLDTYANLEVLREFSQLEYFVEDIIAKIPDEKVIAEGIVTSDIPNLDIYFITGKQINSLFRGYKGKSIQLVIRLT